MTPQPPGLLPASEQTLRPRTQKTARTHVYRCKKCVGIYLAKVDTIGPMCRRGGGGGGGGGRRQMITRDVTMNTRQGD